jgi:hypothetical protein
MASHFIVPLAGALNGTDTLSELMPKKPQFMNLFLFRARVFPFSSLYAVTHTKLQNKFPILSFFCCMALRPIKCPLMY